MRMIARDIDLLVWTKCKDEEGIKRWFIKDLEGALSMKGYDEDITNWLKSNHHDYLILNNDKIGDYGFKLEDGQVKRFSWTGELFGYGNGCKPTKNPVERIVVHIDLDATSENNMKGYYQVYVGF